MKLVIEIPEGFYEEVRKDPSVLAPPFLSCEKVGEIIANGKPLPKGHGRLIDVKDFYENLSKDERTTFSRHDIWMMLRPYSGIATIIREDKEN